MITLTFEKPLKLPRTHYRDIDDFIITIRSIPAYRDNLEEANKFLSQWTGAFKPIDITKTQDARLLAIHRKHVK